MKKADYEGRTREGRRWYLRIGVNIKKSLTLSLPPVKAGGRVAIPKPRQRQSGYGKPDIRKFFRLGDFARIVPSQI
jgi:hypothetical protein